MVIYSIKVIHSVSRKNVTLIVLNLNPHWVLSRIINLEQYNSISFNTIYKHILRR